MGQPRSFVVRYKGTSDDDIERQFALDRQRRARFGYVPTRTEWIPVGGVYSFPHLSWMAKLLGIHPSLLVTYTLEAAAPGE
jgi:hypothetical protein